MIRAYCRVFVLFLAATSAIAGSYLVPPDGALIRAADAAAVVVAQSSHSYLTAGGEIATEFVVRVEDRIAGEIGPGPAIIRQRGGIVGDEAMWVSTSIELVPGERALVLLDHGAGGNWTVHSGELGKFSFVRTVDGREVLVRNASEGEIFGWDVRGRRHVEPARDAAAFLDYVRAVGRDESPHAGYVLELGPDSEVVAQSHVSPHDYLNPFSPLQGGRRQFGSLSMDGVGDQAAVADEDAAVNAAFNAWDSHSGSSISLNYAGGGESGTYPEADGKDLLFFDGPNSGPLSGSVVGQATLRAGGNHSFAGETFWTITECDMIVEVGLSGNLFAAVVAHEVGHCIGFRHANDPQPGQTTTNGGTYALMNSSVSGSTGASLGAWDRDAASHVYGSGEPMCDPAAITTHPQSRTITEGQSASLSVGASGTSPFSYQWFLDGSPVSGANGSSYSTPTSLSPGTYSYTVRVTNSCNTTGATSNPATVTVNCAAPSITSQPQSKTISSGESTLLSVSASGATAYQWYRGSRNDESNPIAGATGSSLNTGPLTQTTSYWVKVSNACGSTSSQTATLTVCTDPAITQQPQSATVVAGQSANLAVSATGTDLTYQWFRGPSGSTSSPVSGANGPVFNTGPLTTTTSFWVRVRNACDTLNSQAATVTVQTACEAPQITVQPQPVSISPGESATLAVSATGTSLQYQWYRGVPDDQTQPVDGATGPTFETGPLQQTTQFWVRVFNSCGGVHSVAAMVTVACEVVITQQPQSVTVPRGANAHFTVEATGPQPLSYQWYVGPRGDTSRPISGATAPFLGTGTIHSVVQFWVRVSSPCGASVDSVTVTARPEGGIRRRLVGRG